MVKVQIKNSTNPKKKKMAIFFDDDGKKIKTTHFGQRGASDYTQNKSDERKKNYLQRHQARENWSNYTSAGSLSRYILWNRKTLSASIADYKRRFNLK